MKDVKLGGFIAKLVIIGFATISSLSIADNIGENFETGSFLLNGSSNIYFSEDSTIFYAGAGGSVFVKEGVSVGLALNSSNYYERNADVSWNSLSIGVSPDYTFGYRKDAQTGFAFTVGSSLNYVLPIFEEIDSVNFNIEPHFTSSYFISPRASLYVKAYAPIGIQLGEESSSDLYYSGLKFGLQYSFARKDITWNNVGK